MVQSSSLTSVILRKNAGQEHEVRAIRVILRPSSHIHGESRSLRPRFPTALTPAIHLWERPHSLQPKFVMD